MAAYPCGWPVRFFDEPGRHVANCPTCKARARADTPAKPQPSGPDNSAAEV